MIVDDLGEVAIAEHDGILSRIVLLGSGSSAGVVEESLALWHLLLNEEEEGAAVTVAAWATVSPPAAAQDRGKEEE